MTYCLRVCTVKYLPSFVCLLALECCCSFHLLATYISSFWPAWCAFTFFFWLFHFLFPITSWMFLFRLNAAIGSFLKISLRFSITCKIFQFFLMVLVVFVRNQLHVITRGILFDFFVWLYVYIYIYIYMLGQWREWSIQPLHAGQLWTENFQVAVFIEPHISLQNCKS